MAEVMEEERLASKSATHKEAVDKEREEEEVIKEQAKLRRISKIVQKGLILGRSASKRSAMSGSISEGVGADTVERSASTRSAGLETGADGSTVSIRVNEPQQGLPSSGRVDEMGRQSLLIPKKTTEDPATQS